MKRKVTIPVVIATTLSGCAQMPAEMASKNEVDRNVAAERPGRNWSKGIGPSGHYDGPNIEVDRRRGEREPGMLALCEQYRNETAKHVLACGFGIDEAKRMAQVYAGRFGREDGYLRGYAWGMNKAERDAENDPNEMRAGEAAADQLFASYAGRAQSEGAGPGSRDGFSSGSEEAKRRFYAAVDTKKIPSAEYSIPSANFTGTGNAYTTLVGRIPRVEDYLKDERRFGRIRIYGEDRGPYMNRPERRERRPHEVWNDEGVYGVDGYRESMDGGRAFNIFVNTPSPARYRYDALNTVAMNEETNDGRFPAEEAPRNRGEGRPNQGQPGPVGNNRPAPSVPPTPPSGPVVTPAPVVPSVNYQAIFREAFEKAYTHFAPFYYTNAFYAMVDDGQRDGEQVGYAIGSDIAQKRGMAMGFDRLYLMATRNAYAQAFSNSYVQGFSEKYSYYKNNSILSLNFLGIIGANNDGIIQPGEDFKVKFKVTNVGGRPSPLTYTVTGNVNNAQTLTGNIEALSTKTIQSEIIGEVDNRLEQGSSAKIAISVNGMVEQNWQKIQRPIEFVDISNNQSILTGSGYYNVVLNNVSTVAMNGKTSVELKIGGKVVKTANSNILSPGEKQTFYLDFNGVDPLNWITSTIPVELVLKYNDSVFANKTYTLAGNSDTSTLASYFDQLANEKGVVPTGVSMTERTGKVKGILLDQNRAEVSREISASGNDYRKHPTTTVPGKILQAKIAGGQSGKAQGAYTELTDAMAPEAKRFKSFLWIHPKRNHYLKILGEIGGKEY